MKRIALFVLMICIMLCGCSKSDSTPVSDTKGTNTPTPEEKAETSHTVNTTCNLCGKITDCKEFILPTYESALGDNIDKTYYFCETCYPKAEANFQEQKDYFELYSALNKACEYKNIKDYGEEFFKYFETNRYIEITKDGVKYEQDPQMEKIMSQVKEHLNIKTNGNTYKISLQLTGGIFEDEEYTLFPYFDDNERPKNIFK